jgi:type IX secretion system PorP/SprF family membrane protein
MVKTDLQNVHILRLIQVRCLMAVLILLPVCAFTQQSAQSSLVMFNRYAVNPAYAGLDGTLSITGAYRAQWLDIAGNPEQRSLNAHMPFYLWGGGIGLNLYSESIGAEKALNASLSYNYIIETDIGLFSVGGSAGVLQRTLDGSLLRTPEGEYEGPTINHNDGTLPITSESNLTPSFAFGLYYAGTSFEGGISVMQLTPGFASLAVGFTFQSRATVQAFGEYFIESFDWLRIYPTLWIKSDLIQTQAELAVRGVYQDFLQLGMGMRGGSRDIFETVVILAGVRLSPQFSLSYAFDLDIGSIRNATNGTHELVLRYQLGRIIGAGLPPRVIYNPRML